METALVYSAIAIIGTVGVGLTVFGLHAWRKQKLRLMLNRKLLLIRLPQQTAAADKPTDFKNEINLSEQLLGILASGKQSTTLEAAVHHVGEEIHFYVAVPQAQVASVSRQVEGLFKDVSITEAHEYNIFQPEGYHTGLWLSQDKHYALPLRTYLEADVDTFSPIVSGLSKINEVGEGAALQVLMRTADPAHKKRIVGIINGLKKGEPFEKIASRFSLNLEDLETIFTSTQSRQDAKKEKKPSIVDEETIKALEHKIAKPLVQVNYRVLVSAVSSFQTDSIIQSITSAFSQFEAPLRNKLKVVKAKNFKKLAYQFSFREFDASQSMILNTEELAGLFHLPSSSTLSPKIKWLKAKEAAPPPNLSPQGTLVGESVFRGEIKPVRLADDDRRRHVYIVGQTGVGKTTLMENMVCRDIEAGKGVAVLDPHGDFVEAVLGLVPPQRQDDVIVFDPGFIQRPIGLNMLEYDFNRPEEKTFIVNEIQSIFNRLFLAETMGPMFEQYMRNALLLLMEDARAEAATLIEVPRIFTDEEFRKKKLARIKNPVVIDFWTKEAVKVGGEASLANMAPYITSKFNNFIANDYMRPIIGQPKSAFNFRQIMDKGKILLVNLSKGRIGDINADLLGMIFTGKFLMAALSRTDMPQEKRRDFNLYIDEFQNFTTDSISTILSEARKYRLNLTIAHQFIAQLTEKIRDAVFGNVGSIIAFRVGPQDAEFLVKQFEPVFGTGDLVNIDNFNAYVKILINNTTTRPFNIRILPHPTPSQTRIQELKEKSFAAHGKDRAVVEQDILLRLRM